MAADITFERARIEHLETILKWLGEPHVQEFWDNTQGHKDDILNFMNGRQQPSTYAEGRYIYFLALQDQQPYALLMMIEESEDEDIGEAKLSNLSEAGTTYGLDYMIGNTDYLGKGYGADTLSQFVDYVRSAIDTEADTFLIDPATDNPRAKHVFMKAGFEHVIDFIMPGDVSSAGYPHHLLVKRFTSAQ